MDGEMVRWQDGSTTVESWGMSIFDPIRSLAEEMCATTIHGAIGHNEHAALLLFECR